MRRPLVWAGCGKPATIRIEVYSPAGAALYGSLDANLYACEAHAIPAVSAAYAVGLTAHRTHTPIRYTRACGHVYRFPTAGGA
ncbi:hypothetical protein [Micromonospora sp. NPDC050695]|uniref:hypothetical protein n=1 Tax=Micromonospora sp. NPDC050695 TaxID=3154938 RepID=UPI003405C383